MPGPRLPSVQRIRVSQRVGNTVSWIPNQRMQTWELNRQLGARELPLREEFIHMAGEGEGESTSSAQGTFSHILEVLIASKSNSGCCSTANASFLINRLSFCWVWKATLTLLERLTFFFLKLNSGQVQCLPDFEDPFPAIWPQRSQLAQSVNKPIVQA